MRMVPDSVALAPLHQKVERSDGELRKEREKDDRRASRTCAACAELCVKEAGCYVCRDPKKDKVRIWALGCVSRSKRREAQKVYG